MEMITIISFAVGIASIVLAIVAMISAKTSEKASQENFEKTQKMMNEIYDKTKDALAQIDKKSEVIENVVQRNQEQLMNTVTNLLNEVVIPKTPDNNSEMGLALLQSVMSSIQQNPDGAKGQMEFLKNMMEISNTLPQNNL